MLKIDTNDLYQEMEVLTNHYIQSLERYTIEDFKRKPRAEVWSMGQIYEHLLKSNRFFLDQVQACLDRIKGELGGEKTEAGTNMYQHGSFPPIKIKIPEAWQGPEPIAREIDKYPNLYEVELSKWKMIRARVAQDEGKYKTRHAACGMLNALEWYQMIPMHLRHHLKQQQELESYWGISSATI